VLLQVMSLSPSAASRAAFNPEALPNAMFAFTTAVWLPDSRATA
jgi:hypothetical protein